MRTILLILIAAALSWGGCRFSQPRESAGAGSARSAGRWEAKAGQGISEILFSFPVPHEAYAGEVRAGRGWVESDAGGRLRGEFTVRVDDVDMGEADLNQNIRYAAEMLRGKDFPEISFAFEDAQPAGRLAPEAGPVDAVLEGTFRLKGVAVGLRVPARLQLVPAASGSELDLRGSFELAQLRERFGISGPGAENDPAGDRVRITVHFVLVSVSTQQGR